MTSLANLLRRLSIRRSPSPTDAARTLASIGPERHRAKVRARALEMAERIGRRDLVERF